MSIDLTFRPATYADFEDPVALALNGIKGQMRREMVRDMLGAEGEQREVYDAVLGPIADEVLDETASEEFVDDMNFAHGPDWLGGEFLPDLQTREVEIARVVLASVTMDVFSLRARALEGGGYAYRFVDECPEWDRVFELTPDRSEGTLTLGEVIALLDGMRSFGDFDFGPHAFVESQWWFMLEHDTDLETCAAFAWVESEQYPELQAFYKERARQWRIDRALERSETCPDCGGTYDPWAEECACAEEVA